MRRRKNREEDDRQDKVSTSLTSLSRPVLIQKIVGIASTLGSIIIVAIACYIFFLAPEGGPSSKERLAGQPPIILWSWENPDDLRFIDTKTTGIAFLAATINVRGERSTTRARQQPMQLPKDVYKIAVIRIETDRKKPPVMNYTQVVSLAQDVIIILGNQKVNGVQIDFDAKESERDFYFQVLSKIREMIPQNAMLSMTSLSSWCLKDTWVKKMPCDEIVPMFFSMGSARAEAIAALSSGDLALMPMQESIGFSVDEPELADALEGAKRRNFYKDLKHIYLFSTHGWNTEAAHSFLEQHKTF